MNKIIYGDNSPAHIEDLALEIGFHLRPLGEAPETETLRYENGRLSFQNEVGEVSFDWVSQWLYHQKQNYAVTKEPLFKALGLKGHHDQLIWDLTCGTGKDSLLMLYFGARVKAFERHPVVVALLKDALFLALGEVSDWQERFQLYYGEAQKLDLPEKPEVIYFDPMYPEKKKKSALPRKEMQVFQSLVGEDRDEEEVFHWALEKAEKRVVVKRSLKAPFLAGKKPSNSYEGKSTRYDMYVCPK